MSRSRTNASIIASCGTSPITYSEFVGSMTLISAAGTVRDASTGTADARSGCSLAATSAAFAARIGMIFALRGGGMSWRACASPCSNSATAGLRPLTRSAPLDGSTSTDGIGSSASEPFESCAKIIFARSTSLAESAPGAGIARNANASRAGRSSPATSDLTCATCSGVPETSSAFIASTASIVGGTNCVPSRGSSTCLDSSRACARIALGSALATATCCVSRSTTCAASTWLSSSVNRVIDCALPTSTSSRLFASSSMRRLRAGSVCCVCRSYSSRARSTLLTGSTLATRTRRTWRSTFAGRSSVSTIARMPAMSAESPPMRSVRPSGPATSVTSSCWRLESSDLAAARIASGDALCSSIAAIARSPRRRSVSVAPVFGIFDGSKPSISAMKRSASSMEPRSPTMVTRSASGNATTVGFLSAGYAANSCSRRCLATSGLTLATEKVFMPRPPAAVGAAPSATGTSSSSIVCLTDSIFARGPRAMIALVRSSAASMRPATRFSSIFWRLPSWITYSTTRSPMSACRLLMSTVALVWRTGSSSITFSTSWRSSSSMMRCRRRICAAVSTMSTEFCCSSAVTEP